MYLSSFLAAVLVIPVCIILVIIAERILKFSGRLLYKTMNSHAKRARVSKQRSYAMRMKQAECRANLHRKHLSYEYFVSCSSSDNSKVA